MIRHPKTKGHKSGLCLPVDESHISEHPEYPEPEPEPASLWASAAEKGSTFGGWLTAVDLFFRVRSPYNTMDPTNKKKIYCNISRGYIPSSEMKSAHIVPHTLGDVLAEHFFGAPDNAEAGHLFDVRNGIPMHSQLESWFHSNAIAIIPANDADVDPDPNADLSSVPKENRYKVIVLDKSLFEEEFKNYKIEDLNTDYLDGRLLGFKSDFRLRKRFLYLHFLLSILRRRRDEVKNFSQDEMHMASSQFWATAGGWLRQSALRALRRRVGHEVAER